MDQSLRLSRVKHNFRRYKFRLVPRNFFFFSNYGQLEVDHFRFDWINVFSLFIFQLLRRPEYFGKFGKIQKIIINPSTNYAGPQVSSDVWVSVLTFITNFCPRLRRMDVAQIFQGLSYKVRSTTSPFFFAFGLLNLVLGIYTIIYQQLVAMLRGRIGFVQRGTYIWNTWT